MINLLKMSQEELKLAVMKKLIIKCKQKMNEQNDTQGKTNEQYITYFLLTFSILGN